MDMGMPQTNMVFCALGEEVPWNASQVVNALAKHGVHVGAVAERRFRLVTHYWIKESDVDTALRAFASVLTGESITN